MNKTTIIILIAIVLVSSCIHFLDYSDALAWNRSKIASGDIWLIVTGNFAHLSTMHLIGNLAAGLFIVLLFSDKIKYKEFSFVFISLSVSIGIGLMLFNRYEAFYGLSGVLHGILTYYLLVVIRKDYDKLMMAVLMLTLAKVLTENFSEPNYSNTIGGYISSESHLLGVWLAFVIYEFNRVTLPLFKAMKKATQ